RAHGRAFGDRVLRSIALYRKKFDDINLACPDALRLAEISAAALRRIDPLLAEDMDGIAEGAEVDPREILVINIRTGLIRMIEEAPTDEDHECTTVSVVPPATGNGHTLMGQNWDQDARCQPNTVL